MLAQNGLRHLCIVTQRLAVTRQDRANAGPWSRRSELVFRELVDRRHEELHVGFDLLLQ